MSSGKTIKELSEELRNGKISSVELTKRCLEVIDEKNPEINAFVSVNEKGALEMAARADEMLAKGEGNELTGIPLGVKDNFCELGVESRACSNILKDFLKSEIPCGNESICHPRNWFAIIIRCSRSCCRMCSQKTC